MILIANVIILNLLCQLGLSQFATHKYMHVLL